MFLSAFETSEILIWVVKFFWVQKCIVFAYKKHPRPFNFHYINFLKLHFLEFIKYTNRYQWYNGIGSFICLYITWKKWNFIPKFPPMEILLNIWWKSLHRNSRYCQNHQNGVTSCFPKMVINMKKNIFCSESSKYRM